MEQGEILRKLESVLEDAHTAVLATTGGDQCPRMRWMTPALLRERPGSIFVVTSPQLVKVMHVQTQPRVEWMFQTKSLSEIVNVCGSIAILDNPSIRAEVLEAIGPRLHLFWKISPDEHNLVVLETLISEATYYLPVKGTKDKVSFPRTAP